MKNPSFPLLGACLFGMSALPSSAAILVYEGFNYGTASGTRAGADLLDGQADGSGGDVDATGLGGVWTDIAGAGQGSNLFLRTGSLTFGDLATSGNSVRSDTNSNNDNFGRSITTSLSGSGEIWFSFLGNKLQNNFSAAEGGLVIGNQQVNNPRIHGIGGTGDVSAVAGLQGFGIAPTTNGNNWSAYAWDGTTQTTIGGSYSVPTNGSQTNLLIGHVSYNTGAGGTDEFSFYYYDEDTGTTGPQVTTITADMANLVQVGSTIEVDVDEGALDFLSLTRQVNTAYDEIRIGTTLDDVLGIPEPKAAMLGALGAFLLLRRRR